MTEGGGSERNNSSKTFNKHWKWKKAFAAHKGNATSTEELASSSSEGKAAALEDVNLSSLNRQIVKDNENSLVSKSTQTPMGKEKAKRQSRSKKKQNQSSSASAPTDAADMPNTSGKNSLAKETRNNKSKQSPILSEVSPDQNSCLINKSKFRGQKAWCQLYPPTTKSVVVVESVTKAKVIQGYLGEMYEVLPIPSAAWSHLKSIKVALSGAENLILASDPDREGEAIAWHIIEMLKQQDALREDVTIARVAPREIDADLVHAYLARRALDYLIGFNVSPLLWRKLPGCQSAGRVQSAALALLCDREKEIDEFKAQEYWTIEVQFQKKDPNSANNISLCQLALMWRQKILKKRLICPPLKSLALKPAKFGEIHPRLAQKLYEGVQLSDGKATGLITYMRTDGLHLSDEAAKDIQSFVMEKYGQNFAAKSTRKYFKKVKNAQEAHEAIRPTDIRRLPSMLVGLLDEDSLKLYILIWSRTMACQMEPAIIEQIQCDIGNANQSIIFRSTCSRVEFRGFQAVYEDVETIKVRNDEDDKYHRSEVFEILSNLKCGQPLCLTKVELDQHYTQPPPRYSEGNYITMKNRTLCPEFRGRMVSAFLSHYFSEVTDYSFTADMETELDNVSAGITEWKGLLKDYWTRFSKYCECASNVHIHQVEKMLEKTFGDFLFSSLRDGNRTCPSCLQGMLVFKVSRFGAGYFIGCDQHPKCKYIAKTLYGEDDDEITPEHEKNNVQEPKLLGLNPGSNEKVLLKCGPYGYYVQLGEDRKGHLPKRASVSRIKDVDSITLEDALDLLQYPVTLGNHPDDGQPVILKLAKVGFSIRHRRTIASVPKNMKPNEITLEKALELLQSKDLWLKKLLRLCKHAYYLSPGHCGFHETNI
ncbi:hypothetical protein Pfo_015579 [Paulownia fortunei]|nr:hypothetical protein Pfo_015579 [Paulownia fortunei]